MKKRSTVAVGVLTAAISINGSADLRGQSGSGNQTAGSAMSQTMGSLPKGAIARTLNEGEQIRDAIALITEEAIQGDVESVVDGFVDADRNRIGDIPADRLTNLKGIVNQIQKDWQAKYNQGFDPNEETVFRNARIVEGRIGDPATVASNWPVSPTEKSGATAGTSVEPQGQTNLERDRDIAVVTLPAAGGLPALSVSMLNELPDTWRFDIPTRISSQNLVTNLERHLTMVKDNAAKWPADVNEAYRLITHHVLMAVYGVEQPTATR